MWQNHEGDYYRLDEPDVEKGEKREDGLVQRRLVECREKRRKYKLPKDVRHPDTKEMHEVRFSLSSNSTTYSADRIRLLSGRRREMGYSRGIPSVV